METPEDFFTHPKLFTDQDSKEFKALLILLAHIRNSGIDSFGFEDLQEISIQLGISLVDVLVPAVSFSALLLNDCDLESALAEFDSFTEQENLTHELELRHRE